MAVDRVNLPTNKEALARLLKRHADRSRGVAAWTWTKWALFDAYMKGCRRFKGLSAKGEQLDYYHLDENGRWLSQAHEILFSCNTAMGLLQSIDLRPKVNRGGLGLGALRDAGAAQAIANSIISEEQIKECNTDFSQLLVTLGTAGLSAEVVDDPRAGLIADMEVVHPREILPFPSLDRKRTALRGLQRVRIVPLDYLADPKKFGEGVKRNIRKLQAYEVLLGDSTDHLLSGVHPKTERSTGQTMPPATEAMPETKANTAKSERYVAVELIETWLYGPRGTVSRYAASSGGYILQDVDYEAAGIWKTCPLRMARFLDSGGFYGFGYVDILFSIVREFEKMLAQAVANVKDLDRYPVTLLPAGTINPRKYFQDDGTRGLQFAFFDPENKYAGRDNNIRPITISPHSVGMDIPGRTAAMLLELVDRYSLVRDLGRDKGRIDSLQGLQFLDETNKRPMSLPLQNLTRAYGESYRYAVSEAASKLVGANRTLPVSELSLDLLGAVVDFDRSEVSFERNPLPDTSRLRFSVQSTSTESPALRKREAVEFLGQGVQDAEDMKLFFAEEGISAALYMKDVVGAVRSVNMNILRLFNDGRTPGQIIANPHFDRPDIQLRVLESFMGEPEIKFASREVQNAFIQYRKQLLLWMQQVLPQGIPDPTEMALLQGLDQQGGGATVAPPAQLTGATS